MATNGKAKQCSNNLTEDKEYNNTSKVAEDVTTKVLIPPDGGWGWVITFSSFMIGMIVDGIAFTFGFFFLEFQEYFGANKSVTSSINSVLTGSYLTIGPVVGALTNVFGCRKVAMVGAVITAVSFFLCTFSPNVETMIILYGLCGGFFVPFIYIPDIAMEHGMTSSQSAWIISSIGIINTVARIVVGWVSDKPWADSILINTAALILTGVITIFVPYYKIYPLYILYAVLFGFGIAVFVSLRSIIIVELLGIDKLTNSFGLLILCQGLSTFIGSPIAGALFDLTGNYMASFYLAGSVICISGLICLPLRRLSRWEKARNERKKDRANMADVEKPLVNGN